MPNESINNDADRIRIMELAALANRRGGNKDTEK
jgi:hypothetical protein